MSVQRFESLKVESLMELVSKAAKAIPPDKFDWSPDQSGKTPQEILEHIAGANHAFAALIRGQELPPNESQELGVKHGKEEDWITVLHKSGLVLSESIAEVLDGSLNDEREMPWGETWKMTRLILSPSSHIAYHWGQLCYLQTLWGDEEDRY
jgi:uncharacterized damage-inducible protein DinB